MLAYHSWLLDRNAQYRQYFTINVTPRPTSRIEESAELVSSTLLEGSISRSNDNVNMSMQH